MDYEFSDLETVRKCWIKDFDCYTVGIGLGILLRAQAGGSSRSEVVERVNESYWRMQKDYDSRENLFKTFELDSEYYPIVLIRSLLPQLGELLKKEDYANAFMVAEWIRKEGINWNRMLEPFARMKGWNPRNEPSS